MYECKKPALLLWLATGKNKKIVELIDELGTSKPQFKIKQRTQVYVRYGCCAETVVSIKFKEIVCADLEVLYSAFHN
jgi:hypothetical protein